MLEAILSICTVLGGLAAGWFIVDKVRTVDWRQYRRLRGTDKREPRQAQSTDEAGARPSWPAGLAPNFSEDLRQAALRWFPEDRLPEARDIQGDWALFGDPTSLFPLMCLGRFIDETEMYACFLLSRQGSRFKVAVVSGDIAFEPIVLINGGRYPQNLFIRTVEPGKYATVKGKGYRSFQDADIPKVLRLRRDGINFGQFESGDSIFHWNPKVKKFIQVPMSD